MQAMDEVEPQEFVGRTLESVTAAWYEHDGRRVPFPVHAWLHVDGLGPVRLHTAGSGALDLRRMQPYEGYGMDSGGVVVVSTDEDSPLAPFVGQPIHQVRLLIDTQHDDEQVGIILDFDRGAVGLANIVDDLVIEVWPDESWDSQSISVQELS